MESDRPLNQSLKAARREKRMSQSDVATAVGCKQSAVSMFENGRTAALADEKVAAICELLGVTPPAPESAPPRPAVALSASAFCPTYDCPSNLPYLVGGEMLLLPQTQGARSADQPHCRYCGEHLESNCPDCGAPIKEGACCQSCGTAYITSPEMADNVADWVMAQQQRVLTVRPSTGG